MIVLLASGSGLSGRFLVSYAADSTWGNLGGVQSACSESHFLCIPAQAEMTCYYHVILGLACTCTDMSAVLC